MFKLALVLFIVALLAAAFGFSGVVAAVAGIAKLVFFIAVLGLIAVLVLTLLGVSLFR